MAWSDEGEQNGETNSDTKVERKGGHNRGGLDLRRSVSSLYCVLGAALAGRLTSVLNGSRARFRIVSPAELPVDVVCLATRAIFLSGTSGQSQRGITSRKGDNGRNRGQDKGVCVGGGGTTLKSRKGQ